jgi:hypothetical protein
MLNVFPKSGKFEIHPYIFMQFLLEKSPRNCEKIQLRAIDNFFESIESFPMIVMADIDGECKEEDADIFVFIIDGSDIAGIVSMEDLQSGS